MVAKHWLVTGKTLMPGYFRVNILDMHENGQMFATQHQVPSDVTFQALIYHLDTLRPADSKHNDGVLSRAYKALDETIEKFSGRSRTVPLNLRKTARGGAFLLDAHDSERHTWHYVLHQYGSPYVIPKGKNPYMPHKWKLLDGADALSKVKEGPDQGKLPVFVRVNT